MPFTKEFLQKIEKQLLDEKRRIESELNDFSVKTTAGNKTVFDNFGNHPDENALEVASFNNDLSVKNALENELRDITSALKSIKAGNYGTCKYCKEEIQEKRLESRPTSSSCVNCKKKFSGEE
jgi:RNA polymerase-binding transcription factor DksA